MGFQKPHFSRPGRGRPSKTTLSKSAVSLKGRHKNRVAGGSGFSGRAITAPRKWGLETPFLWPTRGLSDVRKISSQSEEKVRTNSGPKVSPLSAHTSSIHVNTTTNQ